MPSTRYFTQLVEFYRAVASYNHTRHFPSLMLFDVQPAVNYPYFSHEVLKLLNGGLSKTRGTLGDKGDKGEKLLLQLIYCVSSLQMP